METGLGSFYIPIISKVLCFLNLCISYSDICMLYVYIYMSRHRRLDLCLFVNIYFHILLAIIFAMS